MPESCPGLNDGSEDQRLVSLNLLNFFFKRNTNFTYLFCKAEVLDCRSLD